MSRGTLMLAPRGAKLYYVFPDGTYDELPICILSQQHSVIASGFIDHGQGVVEKVQNTTFELELRVELPDCCIRTDP